MRGRVGGEPIRFGVMPPTEPEPRRGLVPQQRRHPTQFTHQHPPF